MHISEEKTLLRQSIQQRLVRLTANERDAEGRSIGRRLLPLLPHTAVICAYVPLKSEPNITPLLKELLARGTPLYLPVFANNCLSFRQAVTLSGLQKGALGIAEPPPDAHPLDPSVVHTVIVPGLAFDRSGNRLGRGAGGYDRWINEQRKVFPRIRCIGVALDCQLVSSVPMEPHDAKMNMIVTGRGGIEVKSEK